MRVGGFYIVFCHSVVSCMLCMCHSDGVYVSNDVILVITNSSHIL